MPRDRITVGLYSVQKGEFFNEAILDGLDNVKTIKANFDALALAKDKLEPEVVISVLLIPDWENGHCFESKAYSIAKSNLFCLINGELDENGISVEDFYEADLTAEETDYLQGLVAKGSNLDMIKTHAIISNWGRNHLQMDGNTLIHDYEGLYEATFGNENQQNALALNASYYDTNYVSAHNKIVYTMNNHGFKYKLGYTHWEYCYAHAQDHTSKRKRVGAEKTDKNSIYSKDFVVALKRCSFTRRLKNVTTSKRKRIYPADLNQKTGYRLTNFVVTSVKMSWKGAAENKILIRARKLRTVNVGDAACDYDSFRIAIKKFTGNIGLHKYAFLPRGQLKIDVDGDKHAELADDTKTRLKLFALSNFDVDLGIISTFYQNAMSELNNEVDQRLATSVKQHLARLFPLNPKGEALTRNLFGRAASELHEHPDFLLFRRASKRVLKRACIGDSPDMLFSQAAFKKRKTDEKQSYSLAGITSTNRT
jgi:hypothetical protein